jgi:hypothetical protein
MSNAPAQQQQHHVNTGIPTRWRQRCMLQLALQPLMLLISSGLLTG